MSCSLCPFRLNYGFVLTLQVYDGDNMHYPLVGTFCGSTFPGSFVSSGNFLTVHFVSDSVIQRQGFNATYISVPRKTPNLLHCTVLCFLQKCFSLKNHYTEIHLWNLFLSFFHVSLLSSVYCGGTLNATTTAQTLTSPSFPSAYPPYTSCRWVLDAPVQETIKLSVQTFVLQPSQSCSTNYLDMKDWPMVRHSEQNRHIQYRNICSD